MSTVKSALAQKSGALIHVRSGDMIVEALRQMRENRVRSVLVIDDNVLVGIVTQGDCAIKVVCPADAKQTPVGQVMTGNDVLDPRGRFRGPCLGAAGDCTRSKFRDPARDRGVVQAMSVCRRMGR